MSERRIAIRPYRGWSISCEDRPNNTYEAVKDDVSVLSKDYRELMRKIDEIENLEKERRP